MARQIILIFAIICLVATSVFSMFGEYHRRQNTWSVYSPYSNRSAPSSWVGLQDEAYRAISVVQPWLYPAAMILVAVYLVLLDGFVRRSPAGSFAGIMPAAPPPLQQPPVLFPSRDATRQ